MGFMLEVAASHVPASRLSKRATTARARGAWSDEFHHHPCTMSSQYAPQDAPSAPGVRIS